ncbi:hypothetical protein BSK52_00320 [Paenibacillus odorifer]|uniref:DNA-binding protein n=1 Tax=Paenibacillus odorifer TaxID=189426 RepID=A0A1R0Y9I6_9BACL|nr:hypothetical protein BSK52_00320 [Paenibacillus odorifer]
MFSCSKKELAKKLGVTPRTIVNWSHLSNNSLPYHKRDIYKNKTVWEYVFYEDEVNRWLESRSNSHTKDQQNQRRDD